MEFGEKLQELRKNKGMTQEELAEMLYVSRTAISKWESGRGYPSIDSLKEISGFFHVSIDDLLSGEALLTIAERENAASIRRIYDVLFAASDIMAAALILLPLYPETIRGQIYSVNLFTYSGVADAILSSYWIIFASLTILGISKLIITKACREKWQVPLANVSVAAGVLAVLLLAVTREAYATVIAFFLLMIKIIAIKKR